MREIKQQLLTGERALFASRDARIIDCVFEDGESPLKESRNVDLEGCMFRWKYPLWYCENVKATGCSWMEMARAGVWYSNHVAVENAVIQAPKNFRSCRDLTLFDVALTHAQETLWACRDVKLNRVTAVGDYFAMNCEGMEIDRLTLDGNYAFDGVKSATIRASRLLTKDAFWNSENVTVYDSFITGEYLGWNAKNLTLVNCTIESLQGLCYIDGLKMVNCKLINTTLAFEYSTVDAQISGTIDSVLNPGSGVIRADRIGQLILERDQIDPGKTTIHCDTVDAALDRAAWRKEDQP